MEWRKSKRQSSDIVCGARNTVAIDGMKWYEMRMEGKKTSKISKSSSACHAKETKWRLQSHLFKRCAHTQWMKHRLTSSARRWRKTKNWSAIECVVFTHKKKQNFATLEPIRHSPHSYYYTVWPTFFFFAGPWHRTTTGVSRGQHENTRVPAFYCCTSKFFLIDFELYWNSIKKTCFGQIHLEIYSGMPENPNRRNRIEIGQ